jgi:hypothetical protein
VLLSEILQTLLSEIDGAQGLGILRLEPVQDPMQAGAHLVVKVWGWLGRGLQLMGSSPESFVRGCPSPVTINHSIAEQAVEPGHGRFAWLEVVLVLKSTQVRGLENVFGKLRVRDTALHEDEELFLLSEQLIERCLRHRDVGREVSASHPVCCRKRLAMRIAGADHAFTVGTTRAVLAFHGVLLGRR